VGGPAVSARTVAPTPTRRPAVAIAVTVATVAALAATLAACGGEGGARDEGGAAAGALLDSARRDSTRRDSTRRVDSATLARSERVGCPARGTAGDTAVRVHPVNRGTHGMIARTRWLASPDGCALLVMEDPVAVEAEPVSNGGLLVSERGARPVVIAIDSVWDVAIDGTWSTLALGRGWILRAGEQDTVPPAQWTALARTTGVDARTLAAGAFDASGMAYARGVALTYVRAIGDGGEAVTMSQFVGPDGWRVRWRGDTLFVGGAPKTVQDDAEPTRWAMYPPGVADPMMIPAAFAPRPPRWADGPLIELGVTPADSVLAATRLLPLGGGAIARSEAGRIVLARPDRPARPVGSGALLAGTLGGRFLVAVRQRPRPRPIDPALELVVYEVP
jgi:hypothetical protein